MGENRGFLTTVSLISGLKSMESQGGTKGLATPETVDTSHEYIMLYHYITLLNQIFYLSRCFVGVLYIDL